MSVDFFWRQVSAETATARSPKQLGAMVPHWFDPEFGALRSAGLLMGVERNGYLMHFVLTADGADDGICQLPVFGGEFRAEGEEDPEYGFVGTELWVLNPHDVREAARFLRDLDVVSRVRELDVPLAREVAALGFATQWSAGWARSLSDALLDLKAFFGDAAAAGNAVIKFESV